MDNISEFLNNIDLNTVYGVCIDSNEKKLVCELNCVFIPEDVYLSNREVFDEFIKKFLSHDKSKTNFFNNMVLFCSKYHMTDEYFDLIASNKSIKDIKFGAFCINKKTFEKLCMNKSIENVECTLIDDDLFYEFDSKLYSSYCNYHISRFLDVSYVVFDDELRIVDDINSEICDDIINFLDYRKASGKITFFIKSGSEQYIKKILDRIYELKLEGKNTDDVYFRIENDVLLDTSCFTNTEANKLVTVISKTDEAIDLNEYCKTNKEIHKLFDDYLKHKNELSPLESLLWLYSIVSSFRKYKLEATGEDWRDSRLLHKLLFLDTVCCVGFSFLLSYMGSDLDIMNVWGASREAFEQGKHNHMLNLIYFGDPKYNIKPNLYLLDSTFDNQIDKDKYFLNHFLITPSKYSKHVMEMHCDVFSLIGHCSLEKFKELLEDDSSFELIINILRKYYSTNDMFRYSFSSYNAYKGFYLGKVNELYDLFNFIEIPEISFDVIEKALIRVEQLKHPELSKEEIAEKVSKISDNYYFRDSKIYGEEFNKVLSNNSFN